MTEQQELHLEDIIKEATELLQKKYRKGTEEHEGFLGDKTTQELIREALAEVTDLTTYLVTLRQKIKGQHMSTPLESKVLVKKLDNDPAIHTPKKPGDVGFDLEVSEDTVVPARGGLGGLATTVPCAAKIKMPDGMWCQILGRSSAANKKGLVVQTAVIDNGYTGQLFACVWNVQDVDVIVKKGERLAQVVFFKSEIPQIQHVDELPITERGESGFGSTGR